MLSCWGHYADTRLVPTAYTVRGEAKARLAAFHAALASQKPQFVHHGDLASAVTGVVKAACGSTPDTRHTLDPTVGIPGLVSDPEEQRNSTVVGTRPSVLGSLISAAPHARIATGMHHTPRQMHSSAGRSSVTHPTQPKSSGIASCMPSHTGKTREIEATSESSSAHIGTSEQGPAAVSASSMHFVMDSDKEKDVFPSSWAPVMSPGPQLKQYPNSLYPTTIWRNMGPSFIQKPALYDWCLEMLGRAGKDDESSTIAAAVNTVANARHEQDRDLAAAEGLRVPGKVAIQESWQVLCDLFPDEEFSGATPVAFVTSRTTHTQVWVHCNHQASTVRLVSMFRAPLEL